MSSPNKRILSLGVILFLLGASSPVSAQGLNIPRPGNVVVLPAPGVDLGEVVNPRPGRIPGAGVNIDDLVNGGANPGGIGGLDLEGLLGKGVNLDDLLNAGVGVDAGIDSRFRVGLSSTD